MQLSSLNYEGWVCFFWSIFWCSQSDGDPHEDLANFGYKINMKEKYSKISFYIFWYILESCIEIWQSFINYGLILAVEFF